jgi:hypothetical protein
MELMESVECAWTAFWWESPNWVDPTASRYRHAGRWYAPQPDDWRSEVADLHRQGVTEADVFEAVGDVRRTHEEDPEKLPVRLMWPVFVGLVKADCVSQR